ncbi:MAG: YbjN domain-containing protein [Gemmatimonadota bacterium]
MALTMAQLKKLAEGEGFKYFLDPSRDVLMMRARGAFGEYQLLVLLELGGEFLQFRSISYNTCPVDHPHLGATLQLLADLNYRLRFLKIGWDASDGEITLYGDIWIKDGTVTQKQFGQMIGAYLSMMDLNNRRFQETIRTGKDPGETLPGGAPKGSSGLPPEMQALLDKLLEGLGGAKEGKEKDEERDEDKPLDRI